MATKKEEGQTRWRIYLFGDPRVDLNGQPTGPFKTKKVAQLLLIVASQPNKVHSRDSIAETLWPGEYIEIARDRFRQVLALLNKHFRDAGGMPPLDVNRLTIQMVTAECAIDLSELNDLIAQGKTTGGLKDLERAFDLASQPFAEGFVEDWVHDVRNNIAGEMLALCRAKAEQAMESEDFAQVLVAADLGIRSSPHDESLHLMKVAALRKLGRDPEAATTIQAYEQRLQKNLGLKPSRAWREQAGIPQEIEENPSETSNQTWVSVGRPIDSFHGRESELSYLRSSIGFDKPARLFVITGSGGAGKTRLVSEFVSSLPPDAYRRCFVIGLAELESIEHVASTLAQVMDVVISPGADLGKTLGPYFESEPTLLVLDNCEHLLPELAESIRSLITASKKLAIVATSRVRLGIHGEQELALRPLELPLEMDVTEAKNCPSVQLLTHRIRSLDHAYDPDAIEMAELSRLAILLDGIPLAIELAVSQMTYLSTRELRESLEGRVGELANASLDLPARHLSLRETLTWSFEHLSEGAQDLLIRLSVFPGSWTIADATKTTGIAAAGPLIEELSRLAVVRPEFGSSPRRFTLVPLIREFCLEKLDNDLLAELKTNHFLHFLQKIIHLKDGDQAESEEMAQFRTDLPNYRMAMQTCKDFSSLHVYGLEYIVKTWTLAEASGVLAEWASMIDRFIGSESMSLSDQDFVRGVSAHATLNFGSKPEANQQIESLFEWIAKSTDESARQFMLNQLLPLICFCERKDCAEAALKLTEEISDPKSSEASRLVEELGKCQVLLLIGQFETARQKLEVLIRLCNEKKFERQMVWTTCNFGYCCIGMGQPKDALPLLRKAFECKYVHESPFVLASCLRTLLVNASGCELTAEQIETCLRLQGYEESRRQRLGPNLSLGNMAMLKLAGEVFTNGAETSDNGLRVQGEKMSEAAIIDSVLQLIDGLKTN